MTNNQLRYVILAGLFVIPFVPLIVSSSLFFPFITGKAFAFRIIVEIIFACYLILAIRDESYRPKFTWILGSVAVFLVAIGLADIFAVNPFKAFWSNYERMEGYIALLHLGAYFLVLSTVLNTERLWNRLLATSLGASVIMAVYSFLQIAGKITINQGGVRVDGTLGNASYLGIYMVFHIFFAALLFFRQKANWTKILLCLVALTDIIVLYFTATRGAILGLLGGSLVSFLFLVFKSEKEDPTTLKLRGTSKIGKAAVVGIIGLVVFVGLFLSVRNTTFVTESPVLRRFASLSVSEVKTQGRYYVWPMAVKGFVERPILGWGQEGFNFVFNKYFDPRMYNQEPWFDRAHNTYLDWLVAGGALGLLAYLSIWFFLLVYIFRSKDENLSKDEKAIMLGLLSAYAFNNLFVFDQLSSYILFFTVIAYIHASALETDFSWWRKLSLRVKNVIDSGNTRPVIEAIVLILTVAVVYFVIYQPWQQNKDLLAILKLGNEGKVGTIEGYKKPLSGYGMGFAESLEHVSQAAISVAANQTAPAELKQQLFDAVDSAFKKHIERVPTDSRYRLFYGIFLSRFGWYGRAGEQLTEALKFSPDKQGIAFELASNLLLDNKRQEALEVARHAYEVEPSFEEARMIYGLIALSSGDQGLSARILSEIPESKVVFDDRYITILLSMNKTSEIIQVAQRRVELDPGNIQHRITLTAAYLQAGRKEEAIQTLQAIIAMDPSFKEKGEYYISEIRAGRNP